jgi:hypothetical protein
MPNAMIFVHSLVEAQEALPKPVFRIDLRPLRKEEAAHLCAQA